MRNVILIIIAFVAIVTAAFFAKKQADKPVAANLSAPEVEAPSYESKTVFDCPPPPYSETVLKQHQQAQVKLIKSDRLALRAITQFQLDDLLNLTDEQTKRYLEKNIAVEFDDISNKLTVTLTSTSQASAQSLNFAILHIYEELLDETYGKPTPKIAIPEIDQELVAELREKKELYTAKLKQLNTEVSEATPEQKADPDFSAEKDQEFKGYIAEFDKASDALEALTGETPAADISDDGSTTLRGRSPINYVKKGWQPAVEKLLMTRYQPSM